MHLGTCQFCGRTNVLINKEDAWPWWLSRAVLDGSNKPQMRQTRKDGVVERAVRMKKRKKREKRMYTVEHVAHIACRDNCNGGWMGTLEAKNKPFLESMAVSGAGCQLTPEQVALLVLWITKTVMVFDVMDSRATFFSADERNGMTYLKPPDNLHIWTFRALSNRYFSSDPHHFFGQRQDGLFVSAFSFTANAGRFGFHLLACRGQDWYSRKLLRTKPGRLDSSLIPIWPTNGSGIKWPLHDDFDDPDLIALADRFVVET